MTDPDGRRRRPTVSCALCRKRKIRCNRESPCSNCVRSGNEHCVYGNPRRPSETPAPGPRPLEPIAIDSGSSTSGRPTTTTSGASDSRATASTGPATPASLSAPDDSSARGSLFRPKHLEDQVVRSTSRQDQFPLPTAKPQIQTTSSRLGGTFHVHCWNGSSNQPYGIARSVSHKNRLFGQSHWSVNGVLQVRDTFEAIDAHLGAEAPSAWDGVERCKALARVIKAHRTPLWPSLPTPDLPSKEIADSLVDCYLRTSESVYRVLHVPSFRRDYDTFWVSSSPPDANFLAQLQLVLAIGSTTYDERFSLRQQAIRWVSAAQAWLSQPKFKSRLDLQSIQTHLLFLLAQEKVDLGGDPTWILVGALIRKAVYVGLHRDPSYLPLRSAFAVEMRRRLWNTILEVALQSSLTSGGPPFISLGDFDAAPPSNFDDDQLLADDPVPQPADHFTQASVAILLRKTFPQRLAVVKFLNDLGSSGTYRDTLKLDAELRAAYKQLSRTLQSYGDPGVNRPAPSPFEIRVVDLMMHRYLSSLHVPYFGAALHETAYSFSRRVVVESSLKIWHAAFSSSSPRELGASSSHRQPAAPDYDDLTRVVTCTAGFYPTVTIHAAFLIAMELRMQLQEEEGLTSIPLRPDLLAVVDESRAWCLRTIEAGETNVKGYLLMSALAAHIDGLARGLDKGGIARLLVRAVGDVGEKCLPILERTAALVQGGDSSELVQQEVASAGAAETMEDWGFLCPDSLLGIPNGDPMNWIFSENAGGGLASF